MLSFKDAKNYEDFIKIIGDGIARKDSFEFYFGSPNERGFRYLISFTDGKLQKKVMKTLKTIDSNMDGVVYQDEMYRKLTYFLKVGIAFSEYEEYMADLSTEAISTLLTNTYFSMDDEARIFIPLFGNNHFLLFLRNSFSEDLREDIFFAMEQHYEKNPFDVSNPLLLDEFRKKEITRLTSNQSEFFKDVIRVGDFAFESFKNTKRGGKK